VGAERLPYTNCRTQRSSGLENYAMTKELTCICGHRFEAPGDEAEGDVLCPKCGQKVSFGTPLSGKEEAAEADATAASPESATEPSTEAHEPATPSEQQEPPEKAQDASVAQPEIESSETSSEQEEWEIETPTDDGYEIDLPDTAELPPEVPETIHDEDELLDEPEREVQVFDAPEEMPQEDVEEREEEQVHHRNPLVPLTIGSGVIVLVLCIIVLRAPTPKTEPEQAAQESASKTAGNPRLSTLLAQLSSGGFQEMTEAREKLAKLGSQAVPALIRLLDSPEPQVRANAVLTLGRIADPRALAAILERLKDEAPSVRTQAAAALLNRKDMRAVSSLIAAITDKDDEVRYEVVGVLEALCRHSEQGTPDTIESARKLQAAWQKWWVDNRSKLLPGAG